MLPIRTLPIFFRHAAAISLLSGFASLGMASQTLTYKDLVKRLTDLEQLAVSPAPGENGALASSYDRASKYDAAADKYIKWDANEDGTGFIRMESGKTVMADIQGPGCIWRIWSATIDRGHVKIYLDGSEIPAVDLPFADYFDGKNEPFTRPNLVYKTTANGFNNYTPIPFRKSCKIVGDTSDGTPHSGWGKYFQFNYTTFPAGTVVPTFKLPLSPDDEAALDEANRVMGRCGEDPAGQRPGQKTDIKTLNVAPGKQAIVGDLPGPQAITGLRLRLNLPQDIEKQRTLLRQLAVRITWDGEKEPAVWVPLGDFFADAAGAVPYRSLVTGLTEDGQWYSYWYMPFASRAVIAVENDSAEPVSMNWEIAHAPLTKPVASLTRFHAKWHRDLQPLREDRKLDWTLLETQGKGRFVGTQLHIWTPRGGWWGEGDEKFFVDGEKFPSTFGTGSEDYFGYAWSSGKTFVQALHGQPVNEDNKGHLSAFRWHIADNVPFQRGFEGVLEKYFPNRFPTLYAATVYWYLSAEGTDPYTAAPAADRIGYWIRPQVYHEPNAIEAEKLVILKSEPKNPAGYDPVWQKQDLTWSNDAQLIWRPKPVGARLELQLPIDKAGKYRLLARFTKSNDYGIFQARLDGTEAGAPNDLYTKSFGPVDPVDLGVFDLASGNHILGFELMGQNPANQFDRSNFGLDYIKLIPVP